MIARLRLLSFVLITVIGATAAAQDDAARERARSEFGRGVERYEAGDFSGALEAFQEAYRLAPHPSVRVNMANCYEELGRPLEAIFHFERFLQESEGVSAAQRREIEGTLERLRGRVGEVTLRVQPDGALVTIDGAETRRAPVMEPIRMTAGNHTIEVTLEGYAPVRRELVVEAGQPANVEVTLEPGSAATEPAEGVTAPTPAEGGDEPGETAETGEAGAETSAGATAEAPSGGFRLSMPVLIAGGASAALLVGGVATGIAALSADADFEDSVVACDRGRGDPAACDEGRDAADRASTLALVTDILIAGAVVGAGVTAYLFLTQEGSGTERASRPRVTPVATPHGGGLVLTGDF